MSEAERRLITSVIACFFFGYAAINCLVFYRRMRKRAEEYKDQPLESFVHSPRYNWTMWTTGVIGAIGFVIASWELILSALTLLHGS